MKAEIEKVELVDPSNWSIGRCLEWLRANVPEPVFSHTKGWKVEDWRDAVRKENAAIIVAKGTL